MTMESIIETTNQMQLKPIDNSDPLSYTCTCGHPGSVLLFYRYFANDPPLPESLFHLAQDPKQQEDFHREVCEVNNITGKIRVSKEGFNVTVAGSHTAIASYVSSCFSHWPFAGLPLATKAQQDTFFKPTPGCSCVFNSLSVRATSEITPLGITNYSPNTWSAVVPLSPAEFHQKCLEEDVKLIDVRNHYESRIGYFVSTKGGEAIKPPMRRFSQFPQWVKEYSSKINDADQKPLLTYCTGGIRCEKGVRWMEENLPASNRPIHTLDGGIASYITWMEEEIAAGREKPEDSLFKGQNYVFDARGSMGITGAQPVSNCHNCGTPTSRLSKCGTVDACHLVLVICEDCERSDQDIRCCEDCREISKQEFVGVVNPKRMCLCEQDRERQLWGGEKVKEVKTQGWRKKQRMAGRKVMMEKPQKSHITIKINKVAG